MSSDLLEETAPSVATGITPHLWWAILYLRMEGSEFFQVEVKQALRLGILSFHHDCQLAQKALVIVFLHDEIRASREHEWPRWMCSGLTRCQ